ncbi:uncharacterized protein LOC108682586 [Hyalella azteca]|uniref:Uncharacterized protein LOC108682586 n=1 Tax=Hyalella azteca TaxID=294128 RepID=A0A8B7PM45_HYAAZ|nr:uncharacterized protein LOC108682586 [Hyalella azteca]
MAIPIQYRKAIVRTGVIGFGTYLLYKLIMPSDEYLKKFHQDADEKNIGSGPTRLGRVVQLSQQGYSYEAITKIISAEQKERYKALYAKEAEERKRALEREKLSVAAEAKSLQGVVRSTVDTITRSGSSPTN